MMTAQAANHPSAIDWLRPLPQLMSFVLDLLYVGCDESCSSQSRVNALECPYKGQALSDGTKRLRYIMETAYLTSVLVVSEGSCSLGEIADDYDFV